MLRRLAPLSSLTLLALLTLLAIAPAQAQHRTPVRMPAKQTSSGAGGSNRGSVALTRTVNQPAGTTTPAKAFWQLGQPFKPGEVPGGDIVTATLSGSPVRVRACNEAGGVLLHADGSWRWARLLVDYSGQTIAPGSGATLAFTAASGSWGATSTRTNADWEALGDRVTLTNLVTSAPPRTGLWSQPAGTWTATFDGGSTNTQITQICANDLGIQVEVKANFVNGSTTQAALRAVMDYWVTENTDGSLGPVASKGPFVEDMQAFKPNFANYSYDLAYLRGGTPVRSMTGVQQAGMTSMVMPRLDGQWDWTANDPNAVVTQDYTLVRATKTIPPFTSGIAFTGGDTALNIYANAPITAEGGGTFSTGYPTSNAASSIIYGLLPTAVDFIGNLGGLSGIALNTTYWTCGKGAGQFAIYDTLAHAAAALVFGPATRRYECSGTLGQIVPAGAYSRGGLTAELVVAPTQGGVFDWGMSSPGSRPDISWPSEWGADYLVGNTRAWQHVARVQAYTMWGIPQYVINDATGCVPSLMDTAGTPATGTNCAGGAGLGVAKPNATWANAQSYSGDINGANGPIAAGLSCANGVCTTKGAGPTVNGPAWGARFPDGSTADVNGQHWPGAVSYIVWLLEGDHYLQDQIIQSGNRGIANSYNPDLRNLTIGGKTYYGTILTFYYSGTNRGAGWSERDAANAMFAAPEGSAEQTYFRNEQASNVAAYQAYSAHEGVNFTSLGLVTDDDTGGKASYGDSHASFYHHFFYDYVMQSLGMAAVMDGEFLPGIDAIADGSMAIENSLYNNGCGFFGDVYNIGVQINDAGSLPLKYSTLDDIGLDFNLGSFKYSGNTITSSRPFRAPYDSRTMFVFAPGWKFRPLNFDANGDAPLKSAPSPLVDGTDYYIVGAPTSTTFQVSASPAGPPITFTGNVTNGGGIVIPTPAGNCPPTGSYWSNAGIPDSYLMQGIAALGIATARGVSAASSAYRAATGRARPALPAICATEAMWCMGSSF